MRPPPEPSRFSIASLTDFCAAVLVRHGVPDTDARTIAASLVRSEARGWRTHALGRLATYVQMYGQGELTAAPRMRHEARGGAIVFGADGALGPVAARDILALAKERMDGQASLLVVAREIGHLGALGVHALAAAEAGLFCLIGQNTPPLVAMEGFARGAIGNNPIAFGCPMAGGNPLVFDMAASKAARGHILLASKEGRSIPGDWAVDAQGRPTTDAQSALQGALLPFGGAKAMGVAMLVQVLAGALSGTAESLARPPPVVRPGGGGDKVGAFFWFVDPGAFASREVFDASMRQWTDFYLGSSPSGAARLPGHRGAKLEREARERGVALSAGLCVELQALGTQAGVALPTPWAG